MSRLRTYAPINRVSAKVKAERAEFRAVYAQVDERSGGRCEYNAFHDPAPEFARMRCNRRATDHHHLYKPRRSHHDRDFIVHLCRHHHDRCEWPFKRGRLCISLVGGRHVFAVRFASDKFAARAQA